MFNGFAEEGTTDYTSNGLNQYTLTSAAPPPPAGQANPDPETVVATSYTYDSNGSLTSTGRWDYTYDAENRLVEAHDTVFGSAVRFQYDGKGRRIAKLVDDSLGGSFVADKTYEFDVVLAVSCSRPLRKQLWTYRPHSVHGAKRSRRERRQERNVKPAFIITGHRRLR